MHPRNMILISAVFILFGILVLIVGISLLMTSYRYEDPNDVQAVIFRISGRATSITGGILIASTLSTCLYLCIVGVQRPTSVSEFDGTGSQLSKAMQIQPQTRLTGTIGHPWPENRKFVISQPLSRSLHPNTFSPSGDVFEKRGTARPGETNWEQPKTSLGHLQTSNWSNNTLASLPPLGSRRRVKSADATKFGLDYIPTLSSKLMITPANSLDAGNNFQTPRRLWLPNLNNQNTSTLNNPPVTEFGTSHLIGQAIEPLGTMLYTRGRVKLGTYV
ncbi:hypothetical protein FBUS_09107 [Fasciolopsis buskii]|uniref:Uncharacterized protein n=1 Tax=Fasciolopsis buskii TaxID=27845 RepID=A0A8E0RUU2_9TREM|nr:hypothetical protein FBUS_09107 [Fasciolopsis buski]